MRALIAVAWILLLLAGCGGGEGERAASGPAKRSGRLVDFSKKPPYVNALDVDPGTGDFLLTTNRGFFRIGAKTGTVARVQGTVSKGPASSTVGTFLELLATGPGQLIGSGHPDKSGALPPFLGLIASEDGGKSWTSVSRLGEADFHKIVLKHDRVYGFDAVLGAMLISDDGGHRFVERFTPPGLVIDFEVDPEDPDHLLTGTDKRLVRSTDGGKRWRPIDTGEGIRLAWPAPGALYAHPEPGDRDGDLIANLQDNCPDAYNQGQADVDHDGVGNACDPDYDGDGDGVGDPCEVDRDDDGLQDFRDTCPDLRSSGVDTDNDQIGDECDADDDNDNRADGQDNCPFQYNPDQVDEGRDGRGRECDPSDAPTSFAVARGRHAR